MPPEGAAELSLVIAESFQRLVGQPLLAVSRAQLPSALYAAPFALLAHDGGADPRFTYANLTAQRLWERDWQQFVGLPSRLSAEPDDRLARAHMLQQVSESGFVADYTGVRISASGVRFRIADAHVWNLNDSSGNPVGQAARIGTWQPISR
jgi:hypothetical protein